MIHRAFVVILVLVVLVVAWLRETMPIAPVRTIWVVQVVAFAELAVALLVTRHLRSRLAPFLAGQDEGAWWQRHTAYAVVIWALAESAALVGAVAWYLSGDPITLVCVTGVSLALLVGNSPRRLIER